MPWATIGNNLRKMGKMETMTIVKHDGVGTEIGWTEGWGGAEKAYIQNALGISCGEYFNYICYIVADMVLLEFKIENVFYFGHSNDKRMIMDWS